MIGEINELTKEVLILRKQSEYIIINLNIIFGHIINLLANDAGP
jgi:hypothetical protein